MKIVGSILAIFGGLVLACPGTFAQTAEPSVRSAKAIAPNDLGASMYSNANFNLYFKSGTLDADSVTPLVAAEMSGMENAVILDFEQESGFTAAASAVSEEGKVASSPDSPFASKSVPNGSISLIKTDSKWLPKVKVAWAAFNKKSREIDGSASSPGSVFLVKDRPAGDVVASGKQGVIAVRAAVKDGVTGGILFTPSVAVGGFGLVVNNQCASYPGYTAVIAAFDESNALLFTYEIGVDRGKAVYFGVKTNGHPVKSFWVGQLYGMDGTVVDDVTFLPLSK